MWQKLAGSLLLIAYCAGFLPLQRVFPAIDPHIAKTLAMGFWWAAVALVSLDWILDNFIESAPVTTSGVLVDVPRITEPHLPADEAHDFILTRLRAEADAGKSPLTPLQLQFLDYSRIASNEDAKAVEQEFYKQENYWGFKKHIIDLFTVAIKKDRADDPEAWKKYQRLLRDLKKGKRDQQLASLLERAILNARTHEEKTGDYFLYIVIGIASVALLLFVLSLSLGLHN